MRLQLLPALSCNLEQPFAESALPCVASLLREGLYEDTLEMLEDMTQRRDTFADVVDWFLVVTHPETEDMVRAYYNDEDGSGPLRVWFDEDEIAQIDNMLCEELVAAGAV